MPRRHAFTMIELLVVIAIIATLAGLLIPATSMVQSKVKDVRCSNNLRQVATAIIAWQGDHDERCPPKLMSLFSPSSGLQLNGLESKLLICPKDRAKGKDNTMNRDGVALSPQLTELYETGCSYLYQCSETPLTYGASPATVGWFFDYRDGSGNYVGKRSVDSVTSQPVVPALTWYDGKKNQLLFGNTSADYDGSGVGSRYGNPFPADLFPIIMCFHHNRWTPANNTSDAKCACVSWNGNVFWTIPKWENAVNSRIPP